MEKNKQTQTTSNHSIRSRHQLKKKPAGYYKERDKWITQLIEYLDEYEFDPKTEQIVIRRGERYEAAKAAYEGVVERKYVDPADQEQDAEPNYSKWYWDCAIDCVKGLSDKSKEFIKTQRNIHYYHRGYGMYIRNTYIYPSEKFYCWNPDSEWQHIMYKVFSIIGPAQPTNAG